MYLSKFGYDHRIIKFKRNQWVFKECQKSDYVYIIRQGEFELTKKIKHKQNENKIVRDLFDSHLESKKNNVIRLSKKGKSTIHQGKNTLK